ncbi:MAG: hypothetical protein LBL07_01395 [Tannerella sp.]|nr:hypothetical protein [Tannerella sp.]
MKKKFSISFIILAAVVMLMSGMIPHHHHNGVACTVMERCEKDNSVNDEHTGHHADEGMQHGPSCVVESDCLPAIDGRAKISSCDECGNPGHVHFFPILYLVSDFLSYPAETVSPEPGYGEYLLFYTSAEASLSCGLRAPPFTLS